MRTLNAVSVHPYQNHVWVPWTNPGWGNFSFQYFNQSAGYGTNSTTAQLLAIADMMREAARDAGLPSDYKPILNPSEWGYNLIMDVALSDGWATMHGALVAQGLLHLRSLPLAEYVTKAFYFAADDSCCAESGGFFGLWRGAQVRTGVNATAPSQWPAQILGDTVPLPSVAAYATASVLVDVPSGRLPGVFVLDHSVDGGAVPPGGTQLPPCCVAFESDPASPLHAPPMVALFILSGHYNDRTLATLTLAAAPSQVISGVGAPLPSATRGVTPALTLDLSIAALPQYVVLQQGASAAEVCASLAWVR